MKVLFVTSEHPANCFGGLGTFTREYTKELRKYCSVVVVYFHFGIGDVPKTDATIDYVLVPENSFPVYSVEAAILEAASSLRHQLESILRLYNPDVIHCNDRQTYLPFRFDKNVCYSSHLIYSDLLSLQSMNDVYLQELKIEKTAMEKSCMTFLYSDFAQKRASKLVRKNITPIVLPLGINQEFCIKKEINKKNKSLRVSYFGRFEDIQKGYSEFVQAVNHLGLKFKEENKIEYCLFGKGNVTSNIDLSLFEKPRFLQGDELVKAYQNTDIVVMPSRYEPFGLTGLEAMANGCLLLVTSGLGMDMFAVPEENCVRIQSNYENIAEVLKKVICNFEDYTNIRIKGIEDAKKWTWRRCVLSHFYFYTQIKRNRIDNVKKAYCNEMYNMVNKRKVLEHKEKFFVEKEMQLVTKTLESIKDKDNENVLVITSFSDRKNYCQREKNNVTFINVTQPSENLILYRPECLPFEDKQFTSVIAIMMVENCIHFETSLREVFRVCSNQLFLGIYTGKKFVSQTYKLENDDDIISNRVFKMIVNNTWDYSIEKKDKNFLLMSCQNKKKVSQ